MMQQDRRSTRNLTEEEFFHRVSWATRQGTPHWLWPDVATHAWQEALDGIERVSRDILTSGKAMNPLRGEANAMDVAAYTSGMGPLLGFWLSTGLLKAPPSIAEVLDRHYVHNSRRMARLADH